MSLLGCEWRWVWKTLLVILVTLIGLYSTVRPASAAMTCTNAFSDLQFGSVDVLAGTAIHASGIGTINCSGATPNATYQFCVSLQPGPDAAGNQRNMISGSNLLAFNIYWDVARTHPYGNYGSDYLGGGEPVTLQANSSGVIYISGSAFYGVIPGGQQSIMPGSYTENMSQIAAQNLQYGSLASAGSCPTGAYKASFGFSVYATVITNCNVTTSPLTFPQSSLLSADISSTGMLNVQCTNSTPYTVGLDYGSYASGTQRRMYSSAQAQYISYGLYTDAAHSHPWAAASSATSCTNGSGTCYLGTGTGSTQSVTVYGLVPPQTSQPPGTYSDTVTVTVTY